MVDDDLADGVLVFGGEAAVVIDEEGAGGDVAPRDAGGEAARRRPELVGAGVDEG